MKVSIEKHYRRTKLTKKSYFNQLLAFNDEWEITETIAEK